MGRYISEAKALSFPIQVPMKGNHLYLMFTLGVYRNLKLLDTSQLYTAALLCLKKFQVQLNNPKMKGSMYGIGYQPECLTGGPANCYVSHTDGTDDWPVVQQMLIKFAKSLIPFFATISLIFTYY